MRKIARRVAALKHAKPFTPDQIAGLVAAWMPDRGVTQDANGVASVAGAFGTAISLAGAGNLATDKPELAAGLGPNGQPLFKFTAANYERFHMSANLALTACTIVWVSANLDNTVNRNLFGSSPATGNIRQNTGANTFASTTNGGAVTNTSTLTYKPYANLITHAMTYNSADGVGGIASYYVARSSVASGSSAVGTQGFSFNRLGCTSGTALTGTAVNPWQGYWGPVLVYNRVLTQAELAQLYSYLDTWRGKDIYVAPGGNDASTTFWSQTTPMASPTAALGKPFIGNEQIRIQAGGVYRITATVNASVSGFAADRPMRVMPYGSGAKPQFRYSTAPAAFQSEGGGVYSFADASAGTLNYCYYVPGGALAFGPWWTLGSMRRIAKTAGTPTAPGVNEWGLSGGRRYINLGGIAPQPGDIEVPTEGGGAWLGQFASYWYIQNIVVAFGAGRGFSITNQNFTGWTLDGCEVHFGQADGIDTDNAVTGLALLNCVSTWNGTGPTNPGAGVAAGDGYSMHAGQITFSGCVAAWNDKAGFDHIAAANVAHDRCLAIGSCPYRVANGASGGFSLTNSIGIVPAGAQWPHGVTYSPASGPQGIIQNNTFYSFAAGGEAGSGIYQNGAGASLAAQNNIAVGFATGLNFTSPSVLAADHNGLFGNGANYAGASAGTGDKALDPKFVDAANYNFALQPTSPMKHAGATLAGITFDYAGNPRGTPPSIGALE